MRVRSDSFTDGAPMDPRLAFADIDPRTHVALSTNRNPHLAWSDLPDGTQSLVVICHDPDVPSKGDDVNQEGRTVPASLPRVDFSHWVLVDVDPAAGAIAEGAYSDSVTAGGKDGPRAAGGARQGVNNFTDWFAGDADMRGDYYGYDGPGPPWNDELVHHYHFTVYALDVARCPVDGRFGRDDVLRAIDGHVLAQASLHGTYSLNPAVRGRA